MPVQSGDDEKVNTDENSPTWGQIFGRQSALSDKIAAARPVYGNERPLWEGPSGGGWNGGVTQSMIGDFLSCRERFRLKYVLGLRPTDKWNKTWGYGNMWHACEEALAQGDGAAGVVQTLHKHTVDLLRKYPLQADEIEKWHSVCTVQFPEYVRYWQEHPDVKNRTPLWQEEVFDIEYALPSGRIVRLRGKWDSVDTIVDDVTGPEGALYLQEDKTKGEIDKMQIERQLSFDLQTMLYLTVLELEAPVETYPKLGGVRYNVVRRPLSGGRGSISPHKAKSTKTKFTPAETAEQFYERLRRDYLSVVEDDGASYWFFRVRAEMSPQDIQVFRETCLDPILEQMCWWYDEVRGVDPARTLPIYGPEYRYPPMNYRMPFGCYSSLQEGGATGYDHYLETGSTAGLRQVDTLFTELMT